MIEQFRGVGVALVTPFQADKSVDFEGLERLLVHTAEGGVNYWVVQGTTGESVTMSWQEKVQVLSFIQEHNPKNLPIVFGIGGNNTRSLIDTIQNMSFSGVDAILSVSPYYNKPSQAGIVQHYQALADASPVPIILYNVPGRTASKISSHSTLRLAEHQNIIATKEASNDLEQCISIAKGKPDDFLLVSGDDLMTIPILSVGGQGVISVMANAFPGIFSDMVHLALENKFPEANQKLHQLLEVNPLMYEESNPVGVKYALALQGVCEAHVRLPLLEASPELREKIKKAMPVGIATTTAEE